MMALVASVNFALNALKPEHIYDYIEVPSGFRCTRRALVGFPVFFIMIVKLPLVRRYGIIFQDLSGGPLDAPFFKKRVLDAMESERVVGYRPKLHDIISTSLLAT
jgi:hypothetical protein